MSKASELYACLYATEFPLQALLRMRPEFASKPCAVLAGDPPMQQVCSLNARARALGISARYDPRRARYISSIAVLPRSVAEEETAREALLECTGTFSPRVEDQSTANTFLCVIDIAGTETLLGAPNTSGKEAAPADQIIGHQGIDRDQQQLSCRNIARARDCLSQSSQRHSIRRRKLGISSASSHLSWIFRSTCRDISLMGDPHTRHAR